ncbi:PASTA domain-containing protein [Bacteroidales bacterium OttesenSCG-928-M11]|nr:PASTA domain-containing protein [Bacteroidales bacterium OttesenSCG-928-M11]
MNFIKKHPIITSLLAAAVIFLIIVWIVLRWLDSYTMHDKSVEIPRDIIGLTVDQASGLLAEKKLNYVVADSIYVKKAKVGTIFKVTPPEGMNVKEGRTVYLTVYAMQAPLISIPDVTDMSQRQALALLRSIGFENVDVKLVDGPYKNLVVGLESRNVTVNMGERYQNNIPLTLLVSSGVAEDTYYQGGDSIVITEDNPEESWF